jgi:hydroxyacylglutathione hydrolase
LQLMQKDEFIKAITFGLEAIPQYFPINAKINKEGYESLDGILDHGLQSLDLNAFLGWLKLDNIIILDTREAGPFAEGFIPGSINIGLDGRFAEWAGSLLPFDQPIVLVTEKGKERETVVRLARVGFSSMKGCLEGGFETWKKASQPVDMIVNIDAEELAIDLKFDPNLVVIDVRRETEFADGHIRGALNIPVDELIDPASMANIEDSHNVYIHCAGGYRSIIASSLLKRQGIHNIHNVMGGWTSIRDQAGIEIVKENSVLN